MAYTKKQFQQWGRQGGLARSRRLTKAQGRAIAIKAVRAREAKRRKVSGR